MNTILEKSDKINLMGWEEYYRTRPISFEDSIDAYRLAFEGLRDILKNFLPQERPATFVLGGFHPFSGTPQAFQRFCQEIHPNPRDRRIFLDMNRYPLNQLDPKPFPLRVQGRLEDLPFADDSVDAFFLDYTLEFMDDPRVKGFAGRAAECLKRNGVLVCSVSVPIIPELSPMSRYFDRMKNKVPVFPRGTGNVELLKPLRLIFRVEYEISRSPQNVLVFCRPDSNFPETNFFASLVRE